MKSLIIDLVLIDGKRKQFEKGGFTLKKEAEKSTKLSASYVKSLYNLLVVVFNYAKRMEYLKVSPLDKVIPPKLNSDGQIKIYTEEELVKLSTRLKSTSLHLAFQLGINLGLRTGECYTLRWSDFDFNNNTVNIDKKLQYYPQLYNF
ncbi:Arm DNA-binding domain-containing protein [Clostridium cellulovorans]|uniref:Integrase family protein n=1 Tax=Clostridium cellulovorans (strain ATCC 35296 / DSM 3052 / OCM 3 / 743B) TaxID=573061 RepID=D9SPZ3_CLOC7|nr:Arm DNA-binding domain-containing protein [Clostridium cellulovorans]ADL52129.1 integrase family protein [Clostridium cellulovorans 743B]